MMGSHKHAASTPQEEVVQEEVVQEEVVQEVAPG